MWLILKISWHLKAFKWYKLLDRLRSSEIEGSEEARDTERLFCLGKVFIAAHVTLDKALVKSALIEAGRELHGLGVDLVKELVGNRGFPGVHPDMDKVGGGIAPVVDGVGLVIGINDVEVRLGNGVAEEGDVAATVGAALGLGVDANAGGPETEDLGLERVVDLEVLQASVLGIVLEVGVLGG